MFPLKDYKYEIPVDDALGAFGVVRKHDIHTGIDLRTFEYFHIFILYGNKVHNLPNYKFN